MAVAGKGKRSRRPFRDKKALVFLSLMFVSFISLLLSTNSLTDLPKQVGLGFFSFFEGAFTRASSFFTDTFNSISELQKVKGLYDEAQKKLQDYEKIERERAEMQVENRRLRELLGLGSSIEYRYLLAEIIGKDPGNTESTIVIGRGSRDGIRKNMPVVAFQDGIQGLVGKVSEVSLDAAVIMPLYDKEAYVAARIERTRNEGLVSGLGSSDRPLSMKYVKKSAKAELQKGDLVITAGLGSLFPKGIDIGRISGSTENDWDSSITLDIEPVIDYSELENVFVLLSGEAAIPAALEVPAPAALEVPVPAALEIPAPAALEGATPAGGAR